MSFPQGEMMVTPAAYAHFIHIVSSLAEGRVCAILEVGILTHFILETPKGVLAKSADPYQMPHNVASDLGLHYFASCSTIFQQKYLN